jgi:hypothetical protein
MLAAFEFPAPNATEASISFCLWEVLCASLIALFRKGTSACRLVLKELSQSDSESSVPYNPITIAGSIFEEQLKQKFNSLVPKITTQEWGTLLQEIKVISGVTESQNAQRQMDQDETKELGSLELESTNIGK